VSGQDAVRAYKKEREGKSWAQKQKELAAAKAERVGGGDLTGPAARGQVRAYACRYAPAAGALVSRAIAAARPKGSSLPRLRFGKPRWWPSGRTRSARTSARNAKVLVVGARKQKELARAAKAEPAYGGGDLTGRCCRSS
jgi:hypothetical protein